MRIALLTIIMVATMISLQVPAQGRNYTLSDDIRKISVTGKSEITVRAEEATVQIQIRHVKKTMEESHAALKDTLSALSKRLRPLGLTDKEIRQSLVLQGKELVWEKGSHVLTGYYSQSSVELKIKDIDNLVKIYNELAKYENISINKTEYKSTVELEIRKERFKDALLAARKKAEHMVGVLDVNLGKVRSIKEVSSKSYFAAAGYSSGLKRKSGSDSSAGYGDITISVTVAVEFYLQ